MRNTLILVLLISSCYSCVSIIDIAHTYDNDINWTTKRLKNDGHDWYNRAGKVIFLYDIGKGDSITITPSVNYAPFTIGPPFIPVLPVLYAINGFEPSFDFNLNIISGRGIDYDSLKVIVKTNNEVITPIKTYYKWEKFYSYDYHKVYARNKEYELQIIGLMVDGKKIDLPPLILKRKKKLAYVPFTLIGIYR